jgi:hypothetical protein
MPASEYYRGGGGGGFGGFGNYGGGGGFGHTVGSSSWAPPSSSFRQATVARQASFIQQCGGGGGGNNSFSMAAAPASFRNVFSGVASSGGHSSLASVAASQIPEGVRITSSVDVGMGSRDGDMTSFVSASFTSGVDSLTLGASSSVGESGHRVGLESVYSGSGDNTSVLGSIHAITAASIMQLTDRRTDRLSMVGLIEGAGHVLSKIPAAIRLTKDLGRAILLAEDAREQAEEAAKKVADESTSAATGGPKGQLPEGEDPEKKKTKVEQGKSQAPKLGTPDSIYEQIGDDGSVNSRTYYDENGRQFSRQDYNRPHGGHDGPHEHVQGYNAAGQRIVKEVVKPLPSGYPNTPNL